MVFKKYFNPGWRAVTRSALICFSCCAYYSASYAQPENLNQVLEKGENNYPLLKSKQAEVNSSEEQIDIARNGYLPDFTIGHQYTYATGNNVEGAFLPNGGSALSPSGGIRPENIYTGAFGSLTSALFSWDIINFGRVAASVNVADAENERARSDYENEIFQYKVKVADNYLLLLASRQLTKVQEQNLQRVTTLLNISRAMVSADLRPGVDSLLANAEYVKAKLLLLESQKNEKIYALRLNELIGVASDSIEIHPMNFLRELPVSLPGQLTNPAISPLLRFYEAGIDLSKSRSLVVRRSFYPTLSLTGAVWARGAGISNIDQTYHTDFFSGTNYQVYNYLLGITFRWNLASYFRISNDYRSAQFQVERFEYLYKHQLNQQTRDLSEAELQLSVTLQQAELAPVQLQAAQKAYEQVLVRYQSELADLATYQQSLVALSRAEADLYVAHISAWRSLLMKAAAAGDLSIFMNQVH